MVETMLRLAASGHWAVLPPLVLALASFLLDAVRLSLADAREHRLPRRIVWPMYPVQVLLLSAAALMQGQPERLAGGLVGALGTGLFYLLVRLASPRTMGLGDVRLAPVLGWMLGWLSVPHALAGLLGTFLLAGLWSLVLVLLGRASASTHIALGPWMLAATGLAWTVLPASLV